MKFFVLISTYDNADNIVAYFSVELDTLPSVDEVEGLVQLVIADCVRAISTIHIGTPTAPPLYGLITEIYADDKA